MAIARDPVDDAGEKKCPSCWGRDIRPSYQQGIIDWVASVLSLTPYRCRSCGKRFYGRLEQNGAERARSAE